MTALLMLLVSSVVLATAGTAYSRFLARRWGEDRSRLTPAVFMLVTTAASLILLFDKFMPRLGPQGQALGNPTLFAADIVLMVLTAFLVIAGARELLAVSIRRPAAGPRAA